jgi:hypothetical protein
VRVLKCFPEALDAPEQQRAEAGQHQNGPAICGVGGANRSETEGDAPRLDGENPLIERFDDVLELHVLVAQQLSNIARNNDVVRARHGQPFTYDSFSATFPSRMRKTSTPRTCPGVPSRTQV